MVGVSLVDHVRVAVCRHLNPYTSSVRMAEAAIQAVREFDARTTRVEAIGETVANHQAVYAKILVNVRSQMFPVAVPPVIDLPDRF